MVHYTYKMKLTQDVEWLEEKLHRRLSEREKILMARVFSPEHNKIDKGAQKATQQRSRHIVKPCKAT